MKFTWAAAVLFSKHDPKQVLGQMIEMLLPGGILAVMTKRVIDLGAFKNWHYKNDPTHITFFSEKSVKWLADEMSVEVEFVDKDVVFLSQITNRL